MTCLFSSCFELDITLKLLLKSSGYTQMTYPIISWRINTSNYSHESLRANNRLFRPPAGGTCFVCTAVHSNYARSILQQVSERMVADVVRDKHRRSSDSRGDRVTIPGIV